MPDTSLATPAPDAMPRDLLRALNATQLVKPGAEGSLRLRAGQRPGCALYGPYWQLPAGGHVVTLSARAGQPGLPGLPVLALEVIAQNRLQVAWLEVSADRLAAGPVRLGFTVPPELAEGASGVRFEVRLIHYGHAELQIRALTLAPEPGPQPCPRSWRVPGRWWRWGRGGRLVADAALRRGAASLSFGWAFFRLPQGRYRVEFRTALAAPPTPGTPVLRAEVRSMGRWRLRPIELLRSFFAPVTRAEAVLAVREFTAAEVATGQLDLPFAMPAALALDTGAHGVCEIAFTALGRARPWVGAVQVQEVPPDPAAAAPLAQPASMAQPAPLAQPALISPPRTRLVVVGNCQAETLADALQSDAALNRRFATKYHFARLQEPFQAAAREDLAQADVILAQDIHDWTLYPLREAIRPDTEIRPFPLLNLASPWPFDHHNGAQDRTAHEAEWPNLTFQYFDGLLGRLRQDIPDPEARFAAYAALDVPGVLNHRRLHQFEARRLQALDVKYPWGLGQHILDNFRQKRLFHTTTHPTRDLFCLLLEQLVTPLGHRRAIDRANPKLDQLGDLQVPVHPLVAAALGLAWATPATRYRFKTEDVTWDQYIRRYIAHYG